MITGSLLLLARSFIVRHTGALWVLKLPQSRTGWRWQYVNHSRPRKASISPSTSPLARPKARIGEASAARIPLWPMPG